MLASGFYQNKRLYPVILYNEDDINHGADTITNRGSGGSITMTNFARNNGTVTGGVTISDGAMVFNGSTGYVTVPNSTDWSGVDWSVSGEMKFDTVSGNNQTILQQADGTGTGRSLLYLDTNTGYLSSFVGGSLSTFSGTSSISIDTYYSFVLTKSGTTLTLYVDGDNDTSTKTMESATGNFLIGVSKVNSLFLDGNLRYLRFYNKSLSSGEAAQEIASDSIYSTINDGSLVWQMTAEDFSHEINTIEDQSGNGNDGTVTGGVTIENDAINFDGSTGYINTGTTFTSNVFRITGTLTTTNDSSRLLFDSRTAGTSGYVVYKTLTTNNLKIGVNGNEVQSSGIDIADGGEHTFDASYDGSTIRLILDGETFTSSYSTASVLSSNALIGTRSFTSTINFWDGSLKDINIYENGVLKVLYNQSQPYYPTTIYDTNMIVEGHEAGKYAIEFDGSNDYLVLANSTDYSAIDWSIFSRVYINDLPSASTGGVISSQADGTGTGRNLLYVYNAAGTYQWRTAIGGSATVFSGLTEPSSGTWYNTCLVKQGTSLKLYVNTEDSSLTKTMESATGNFIIGSDKTAVTWFFDGPIQDPRIFKKALTPTEIQRLFNS